MQTDSHTGPTAEAGPQVGEPSLNQRLVAIGVSHPYASQLATGKRTPSLPLALEIEARLGIKPSFWSELKAAADAAKAPPAQGCAA